ASRRLGDGRRGLGAGDGARPRGIDAQGKEVLTPSRGLIFFGFLDHQTAASLRNRASKTIAFPSKSLGTRNYDLSNPTARCLEWGKLSAPRYPDSQCHSWR